MPAKSTTPRKAAAPKTAATAPAIDPFSTLNTGTAASDPASASVLSEGGLSESRPSDAETLGTSLGEPDSARTEALTSRENGNDAEQAGGSPAADKPTFIRP
jgi:hypothetical protein